MRAQVPQGEGVHGGVGVMWSRTVKSLEHCAVPSLRCVLPALELLQRPQLGGGPEVWTGLPSSGSFCSVTLNIPYNAAT